MYAAWQPMHAPARVVLLTEIGQSNACAPIPCSKIPRPHPGACCHANAKDRYRSQAGPRGDSQHDDQAVASVFDIRLRLRQRRLCSCRPRRMFSLSTGRLWAIWLGTMLNLGAISASAKMMLRLQVLHPSRPDCSRPCRSWPLFCSIRWHTCQRLSSKAFG